MGEDGVICRTCLKEVRREHFIYLDEGEDSPASGENVKEMLQFSVPELDLYVSARPALCNHCIKTLVTVYNFKVKCLNSENVIKGYITRNNLIDYSYVNLNNVVAEEAKIKTQMDGKAVKNQIEDKIRKYMQEDEKMDDTEEKIEEETEKVDENLPEMSESGKDSEETESGDSVDTEMIEDVEDNIPLSEVLNTLCKSDEKSTDDIDKPEKIVTQEAVLKPTSEENITSPTQQKFKIIPVTLGQQKPSNIVQTPITSPNTVPQVVFLPQGLGGGKPMCIRIDLTKFMQQNKLKIQSNETVAPTLIKNESVSEEHNEMPLSSDNLSTSEMSDESDDAFDESVPARVKQEAVTITEDDIVENGAVIKPQITLIKPENLLKKPSITTTELTQLLLRKPSELYKVMSTANNTIINQPKFIFQQAPMGGASQPKFIIQPTISATTQQQQPQIILNSTVGTITNQPKIIIQQNKDGTFKTVQQVVTSVPAQGGSAGTAGQKLVLKTGVSAANTAATNIIKIVPGFEAAKTTPTKDISPKKKDLSTVPLENMFKVVNTHTVKETQSSEDYVCPQCPFSTTKVEFLGKHITTVHPKPSFKIHKGPHVVENYACFLCPFSASTMELLRGHHMNFHADQLGDEQMRNFLSRKKRDRTPASCSKEQQEKELQILEKVMKRPEYACNVCIYTTKDKSNFRKHLFTHGKPCTKPMQCPICSYNCVSPYQMRRHYRQRHPEKDFAMPKGKPYPPVPAGCVKQEIQDEEDYKITLDTLKGKGEISIEGTVL